MHNRFIQLFDSIYDAAFDQSQWKNVVKNVGEASGGFGGALVLWDTAKGQIPVAHNQAFPDKFWHEYSTHYIAMDPRAEAFISRPHIEYYTDATLISAEVKRKDCVINEVRKNTDQRHGYGARLFANSGFESTLILARNENQGEAQQADLDTLGMFVPHLRRSITLARRIGERVSAAAFDVMSFGVLILGENGEVNFCNKMMAQIAAEKDGLRLTKNGLMLDNSRDDAAYRNSIEHMRRKLFFDAPAKSALPIHRPSGKRPYSVLVSPFPGRDVVFPGFAQSILVCVADPAQTSHLTEDVLAALFSLSPAEARLAINLIKYGTLAAAAQECGLTEGSARQYMKRIFSKTGTQGQVELVALIMGSARL